MTDTFRALCAELANALDSELDLFETRHSALLDRARAALAEGDGVVVKDEELTALVRVFHVAYNAKRTELCALPNRYRHDTESAMADRAGLRAVLARYGTHPRPIPVAERLPAKADCDAKGRCWLFAVPLGGWLYRQPADLHSGISHWRPATAIPLPEESDA